MFSYERVGVFSVVVPKLYVKVFYDQDYEDYESVSHYVQGLIKYKILIIIDCIARVFDCIARAL